MNTTHAHSDSEAQPDLDTPAPHRFRHRLVFGLALLLAILLLAFIPPLINVSRLQRRVDGDISAALGRPVHFGRLSLTLLPLPGFTLDNFVIDEDPAFGSEPTLRADQVSITLRVSSLWRRRIEFSTISFTDPSVNLVHLSNGQWNIQNLLLQASHIEAAPTAQRFAGPAPRFPYIEATGARLNVKLDQEKIPFSFTDSDFALWLPEPHQWHLRIEAHPTRTDTSPGETGTFRVEGTLGNGTEVASLAQVPIDLNGAWQDAQLGGLSQLLSGSDAGLRGDISLTFHIVGTVDRNAITTRITLANARRADFIPSHPLALQVGCSAIVQDEFHSFTSIGCHWPPADSSSPSVLTVAADLPDVRHPQLGSVRLTLPSLPADTFFDWLSVATPHPPIGFTGPGTLAGTVAWGADPEPPKPAAHPGSKQPSLSPPATSPSTQTSWTGELEYSGGSLQLDQLRSIPLGDIILRSTPPAAPPSPHSRHHVSPPPGPSIDPDSFDLLPVSLPLGGKEPATLTGHLDASGYTLHLTGLAIPARLLALGNDIPQLGDGLTGCLPGAETPPAAKEASVSRPRSTARGGARGSAALSHPAPDAPAADEQPVHIDLTAIRAWGGPQTWCQPALSAANSHDQPK